jgi:8-oxo-dGTP pyrophosphatase MutT (NUDIX family)
MKQVVVGIISRKNDKGEEEYLLVRSAKNFGKFTGMWYPPGGHVEQGEDERSALRREIWEELGILVTVLKKLGETAGDVPDQTTHWWKCRIDRGQIHVQIGEIVGVRWCGKEAMEKLKLWPATKAFFESYFAGRAGSATP